MGSQVVAGVGVLGIDAVKFNILRQLPGSLRSADSPDARQRPLHSSRSHFRFHAHRRPPVDEIPNKTASDSSTPTMQSPSDDMKAQPRPSSDVPAYPPSSDVPHDTKAPIPPDTVPSPSP
ncbi:hypothetical protein HETIRDRAFT_103854, partial [Heterobasidion irregulare TC 32-1]